MNKSIEEPEVVGIEGQKEIVIQTRRELMVLLREYGLSPVSVLSRGLSLKGYPLVLEALRRHRRARSLLRLACHRVVYHTTHSLGARRRLKSLPGGLTTDEWEDLCREYGHRCGYCYGMEEEVGALEPDHMIPVSRGGSNLVENIRPACGHCDKSKGNKTFEEFMEYRRSNGDEHYVI